MLQLHDLNARARTALDEARVLFSPGASGAELESHVDATIAKLRAERTRRAREVGGFARVAEALDRTLRTDAVEYLDRPDVSEKKKLSIVRGVHVMNTVSLSYRRFLTFLRPEIEAITKRTGRPARILELASGAGGFALALASLAKKRGLEVEVTGSDIVPLYVTTATKAATARGIPATFRLIDALDMSAIDTGAYDIVFIAQSTHHFSPGQIARMIRESRRVATTSFVSIDGWRSLHMVAIVAGTSILSMQPALIHDAVVTARKFYSEPELRLFAQLAVPEANVHIARIWPLNSVLRVEFPRASAK
jgi:2-polyprenyl-3-methyl-5-hydroxy-6-metoxy-1,4-benzoquinol methylase